MVWDLGGIYHGMVYLWYHTMVWYMYGISRLGFLYLEVAILIIILVNGYAESIRYRIECDYVLLLYVYERKRAVSAGNKKSLSSDGASRAKSAGTS